MFWHILKKDMMKRKAVNFILFLFITLATIFLASSINNIMVINSAIDYYMDYANVPNVNIILSKEQDKPKIDKWLLQQKDQGKVSDFDYNQFLEVSRKSITVDRDGKVSTLDDDGANLFLVTMDVDYCKVYDKQGNSIVLKEGEIALSLSMMKKSNLRVGDKLIIESNHIKKELIIKEAVKDAAFGNEMVGMSRIILNENDYRDYQGNTSKLGVYYVMTLHGDELIKELNNQGFDGVMQTITDSVYKMVYSFDMIIAGLFIVIGICFILIALLVLRFTLVFSIEEQYQEIGILKAIGLKNSYIKKIYLVKYLAIVLIGGILGTMISIPISQMMIKSVSVNMIMASDHINIWINILCFLFVVGIVLLSCYLCTRRLNKVSAITAIRSGSTGERFQKHKGFHLYKLRFLSVTSYLGINDIMSHISRYIVLIITFCISFILITIPLNTLNTMNSEEMMKKFSIDPNSSVYLRKIEKDEDQYHNVKDLLVAMDRVEKEMENKGYQVEMTGEPLYFINYNDLTSDQTNSLLTIQLVGKEKNYGDYEEGQAPLLENEVAFSKDIMEENDWNIGDTVNATINGQTKQLIITGIYSDYMQLGKSARLNNKINCDQEMMFECRAIMVDIDKEGSQEELASLLQKEFPDYNWLTAKEIVDESVGGIQDILADMLLPITFILCVVIMLITLLMEKLFITRERGEIAMLKSIGFPYRSICKWQLARMFFVVVVSMIISIPLSLVSNHFILKPIFKIMGASVNIQVDPLEAYLIYPGILLIGILLATMMATRSVKHINVRKVNNLE